MIRHTILFKLKSDVSKQEVERVFTDILGFTHELPGILAITGGTCYFDDKKQFPYFSHGFSIDFEDKKSRDAFLHTSAISPVRNSITTIADGGWEGVFGFDFGA